MAIAKSGDMRPKLSGAVARDFHIQVVEAKDAEIAQLRSDRAIHLASIAEHSLRLAIVRAALVEEQKACDSWRSLFVLIPCDCLDSVPLAEFNGPNHREHGAIGAACKTHDARRAANVKEVLHG